MAAERAEARPRHSRILPAVLVLLAACGDGPTATDPECLAAPVLSLADTLTGTLDPDDPLFRGARVDYFGLRLSRSAPVRIELRSDEFDPLLLLFHRQGELRAQAYDTVGAPPGEVEVAGLEQQLLPGCHLVAVNAWQRGAGGAYRLVADTLSSAGDPR